MISKRAVSQMSSDSFPLCANEFYFLLQTVLYISAETLKGRDLSVDGNCSQILKLKLGVPQAVADWELCGPSAKRSRGPPFGGIGRYGWELLLNRVLENTF